jgi:hypothetical protein
MKKIIIKIYIYLLFSVQIYANSSIFGLAPNSLGTVNFNNSTAAVGRGGFEVAYFDTLSLNNVNYAQWPFLTQTTISLNMAYKRLSIETNLQSTLSYSGNFQGGHLAIPVIDKKLAFGIGLLPALSNNQSASVNNISVSANVIGTLKSTGNISKGSFIGSYAFNDNISIAGVLSYNFGLIEDKYTLDYDAQGYSDVTLYNNYKIYGTSFALHSFIKFSNNIFSGFNLSFPAKFTMNTEQSSVNTKENVIKTRTIDIPLKTSIGIAYLFENQYIAGIDINYQFWKNGYKIEGEKQNGFENGYRISLGLEKVPSGRRFVPYHQKMYYRGGLYLGQLNIQSNNRSIFEYGIGLGIGLPVLSPSDRFDLSFQYGKRGDLSTNLATENIYKFNISITAGSLWFVREDN